MFANERQDRIVEMIKARGAVKVGELAHVFSVSNETVRRDLLVLEKQKRLQRVHGGAVAVSQMKKFNSLPDRINENSKEKAMLAELACSFIHEEDIISIDAGSTAIEFAELIKNRFRSLTVVTHSLDIFERLCDSQGFQLILCGGQFSKEENAFYGPLTRDFIARFHVSKAFIFPSAISLKGGVADYNIELVEVQKTYMKNADEVIIMADSSKYEKHAFIKLCDLSSQYILITDSRLSDEIYDLYKENNINIYKK